LRDHKIEAWNRQVNILLGHWNARHPKENARCEGGLVLQKVDNLVNYETRERDQQEKKAEGKEQGAEDLGAEHQ
jgi:hypothetical protein